MAKVMLEPIGEPRESFLSDEEWRANVANMDRLGRELDAERDTATAGWGPASDERVRQSGKLTVWERVERLMDPDASGYLPIGTLANHGERFGGGEGRTAPGAGVFTGFVPVQGRWVVVVANDNRVAAGAWWPRSPEKIQRAQEIALRLRLPIVYLVDCSGLFLPEQARTFPGRTGAGAIFRMNARLSDAGVPQIAGVMGDCIAGGAYMPIISDVVYMTEQAYMVIAGASLVRGAKSGRVTSREIGGPDVHVHISRCADHRAPDDATLIDRLRQEVSRLPGPAWEYYRYGAEPAPPAFDPGELDGLMPADRRAPFPIRQVIARLVDHSLFQELRPDVGAEIVCGVGRVDGLYAAFVANDPEATPHPELPGVKRPGRTLYREGIAKMSQFVRACDDDGIPIVWLQDCSGFDIGAEAERQGLLGFGSSLIHANANVRVPVFTVLLRNASGAGYYAMSGMPYRPLLQLATPLTRLGVMDGRTLALGAFGSKLDDEHEVATDDEVEAARIRAEMQAMEARIEGEMDPMLAAARLDVDEIVLPGELRTWLEAAIQMAWQSTGYRRTKNPRIWTLHDLAALEP